LREQEFGQHAARPPTARQLRIQHRESRRPDGMRSPTQLVRAPEVGVKPLGVEQAGGGM
jgi:hypothetical protein